MTICHKIISIYLQVLIAWGTNLYGVHIVTVLHTMIPVHRRSQVLWYVYWQYILYRYKHKIKVTTVTVKPLINCKQKSQLVIVWQERRRGWRDADIIYTKLVYKMSWREGLRWLKKKKKKKTRTLACTGTYRPNTTPPARAYLNCNRNNPTTTTTATTTAVAAAVLPAVAVVAAAATTTTLLQLLLYYYYDT